MSHTKVVDNIEYGYSVYKHVPLVQKQSSFIDDIILAENFLKRSLIQIMSHGRMKNIIYSHC